MRRRLVALAAAMAVGAAASGAAAGGAFESGPSAPSSASASATMARRGAPVLIAGGFVGRRPREIDFSSDAGNIVTGLKWSRWSAAGALGKGASDYDSCVPDCATARLRPEPATVSLSMPRRGHFTSLIEERGGQTLHFTYPGSWPRGASSR